MNIITVDDEEFALKDLTETVEAVLGEASVNDFRKPSDAITFAEKHPVHLAFLDVEMGSMDGISLAKQLNRIRPETNIIFVTGFADYALDAFEIFASGYVLKPVTEEAVRRATENLRNPLPPTAQPLLTVKTFGNFEVLSAGKPLHFYRSKAKELFAYLIMKRGTSCNIRELCAVLYGDRIYDRSLGNQIQTVISSLMKTLSEASVEESVERNFNSISIRPESLNCDFYHFLEGNKEAILSYTGEFMSNYEWAETTNAYLSGKS